MYNAAQGIFYTGPQSVSPVGSGDASNGTSIDATSGDVVLGNDFNDAAEPGRLLSSRQILMNGNQLLLFDTVGAINARTFFTGAAISMFGDVGDFLQFQMIGDQDVFGIEVNGGGTVYLKSGVGGSATFFAIRQSDGVAQMGTQTTFNNASLQVSGTMTSRAPVQNMSSGTVTIDRELDSGKVISNTNGTGLVTVTLPNMIASIYPGFHIYIIVNDTDGIRVTAPVGATINLGGAVTASGGSVTSTTLGSAMHLFCVDPARWNAVGINGTWTI